MSGVQILPSPFSTMKIRFVYVGKLKQGELATLFHEYAERIKHYVPIHCLEIKDSTLHKEAKELLEQSAGTFRIALAAEGKQYSSEDFARLIQRMAKDVSFLIGGPEGLSLEVKKKSNLLLSLSLMTFPHELTRVLLAEQVFRSCTIMHCENYHR